MFTRLSSLSVYAICTVNQFCLLCSRYYAITCDATISTSSRPAASSDRHVKFAYTAIDSIFHVIHATRDDIYQFVPITEYVNFILICDDKVIDSVCAISQPANMHSTIALCENVFSLKTKGQFNNVNESSLRINEHFVEFK